MRVIKVIKTISEGKEYIHEEIERELEREIKKVEQTKMVNKDKYECPKCGEKIRYKINFKNHKC